MDEADPPKATYPDDSLIAALQRAKMEGGGGVTKERFNLGWLERPGSKRGRSQATGNTPVS